ncbi:MAG: carbohydrate ABC transporter permease [Clostridia bacterium]
MKRTILPVLTLVLLSLMVLAPLYLLASGALMGTREIVAHIEPVLGGTPGLATWPLFPKWPTLSPLVQLLLDTPAFFTMFWNACILTFSAVAGQVLISSPAAWGLARYKFRGKKALYMLYILLMLMPFQVLMAPSFFVMDWAGLIDTRWAVILPSVFSAFPVFILYRFFEGIPEGFVEAAQLDGAGPVRVFCLIGLPLGMPGVLSVVVLGFLENWSAIEQPLTFLRDKSLWPLSLMLSSIAAEDAGAAFSASLMTMLPALLVFLWGQPYLEDGIRAAGLKE